MLNDTLKYYKYMRTYKHNIHIIHIQNIRIGTSDL